MLRSGSPPINLAPPDASIGPSSYAVLAQLQKQSDPRVTVRLASLLLLPTFCFILPRAVGYLGWSLIGLAGASAFFNPIFNPSYATQALVAAAGAVFILAGRTLR